MPCLRALRHLCRDRPLLARTWSWGDIVPEEQQLARDLSSSVLRGIIMGERSDKA